jgi:hypothetical protein
MAGSQRVEQELGESLDACRRMLGESFRSILRALDPGRRLKRSLRNHASVWISLAAILGWVLSRIPAKRHKVYVLPSNEDQKHRGRKTSLSVQKGQRKGRPTILSMGLELMVAVGLKILERYGRSWSSELFSNRKRSAEKAAVSGRGLDKIKPRLRYVVTCTKQYANRYPLSRNKVSLTKKAFLDFFRTTRRSGSKTNAPSSAQHSPILRSSL